MTAEALKTMTTPISTSNRVEAKSHLSMPTRFATYDLSPVVTGTREYTSSLNTRPRCS